MRRLAGRVTRRSITPGLRRAALAAVLLLAPARGQAGPPYLTDDPEPVEHRHWEFYVASQDALTADTASGTAPHLELNYGVLPGVQLHVIVPLAYARPSGGPTSFGIGDAELGVKVRLLGEGRRRPMVGIFTQFELPLGDASRGLGTGHLHVLIPLWLQKSFGPWTTYGGGGYWINPGEGNRNYWFAGGLVQRRLSDLAALGAEVYYTTPDEVGGRSSLSFNLGLVVDLSERHHLLVSAGRSIVGDTRFQAYLGYQLTL